MYGDKGAPKGYSTPRLPSTSSIAQKLCQKCGSQSHWTFECSVGGSAASKGPGSEATSTRATPPVPQTSAKLSRTQLLRLGIKQKRTPFEPELTEREIYEAAFKQEKETLFAQAHQERKAAKRQRKEALEREKQDNRNHEHRLTSDHVRREPMSDARHERRLSPVLSTRRKVRDTISSSDDDDNNNNNNNNRDEDADSVSSADSLDLHDIATARRHNETPSNDSRGSGGGIALTMNMSRSNYTSTIPQTYNNRYIAPPTLPYDANPMGSQNGVLHTGSSVMRAEYTPASEVPVTSRYPMPPAHHSFIPMPAHSQENTKDEPLEDV